MLRFHVIISFYGRGKLLTSVSRCSSFNSRIWRQHFVNSMVDNNDLISPYILSLRQMLSDMTTAI